MFDRRLIECFDWSFLAIIISIIALGLLILYSAVNAGNGYEDQIHYLFKKQLVWLGLGFFIAFALVLFDFRHLDKIHLFIYGLCIALLLTVHIFGHIGGGSKRWLSLGFFRVQPSELMKIALIISISSVYSRIVNPEGLGIKELLKPAVLCLLPFGLIVTQPDLGTGLLLLLIVASVTWFIRVEKKVVWLIIALTGMIAPIMWFFGLHDYQKNRILTFLDPGRDPLGAGYHIIQSKIAIGSGMLTGKGFLHGTQNSLSFLPEQHTDFILSVLAEEWGLAGCSLLLILYFLLILWGLNIAYNCRSTFGTILAMGIIIMIFWQIFINIGMVMGLMPVVGVPLPLVSYGGSSVMTNMMGLGILLNISMRKFTAK